MSNVGPDSPRQPGQSGSRSSAELAEVRRRLIAQIAQLRGSSSDGSAGISFGKRIGEGTSLAVERLTDVAVHDRLVEQLTAVRRAEEKLVEGTSASCDVCEGSIEEQRQRALAWAVTCMDCADDAVVRTTQHANDAPVSAPRSVPATESPWHSALGTELPSDGD